MGPNTHSHLFSGNALKGSENLKNRGQLVSKRPAISNYNPIGLNHIKLYRLAIKLV